MSLFKELERRNVFRVALTYLAVSWLLIQVAETLLPIYEIPAAFVRLVVTILAIGFPLIVIFSWAFEITPEGLKREKDVNREESITRQTGKKLDRIIMVVLTLAVAYFAFDKFVFAPRQLATEIREARREGRSEAIIKTYGEKSIAVLPFADMSPEGDQDYFSSGISEELLHVLSKIPELRVISRSSAFSYKGKDADLPTVADELNVAYVLEGSVRKAGNKVRITAQLIEAHSDTHLWSETFDRELNDIFAIQEEISASVVRQLKLELLGEVPKVQEADPNAYALYLQARQSARQRTPEGFEQSIALYEQALAIDPEYTAAWNGLAATYRRQTASGLRPFDEGYQLAREAAGQAVTIDPDYAPATAQLGRIAFTYSGDLVTAARHLQHAVELEPANPEIFSDAAVLALNLGRVDDAVTMAEYVVARDPLNPAGHSNLGFYYLYAGKFDKAIASYKSALGLSPGRIGANYEIGVALLLKGEPESALAAFAEEGDEEYRIKGTAMALHDLNRRAEHEEALGKLIAGWGERWPSEVAQVYAWTGTTDVAFEWLDKAVQQNEEGIKSQFQVPLYASLHSDPRWAAFRDQVGTSEAELAAVPFQVALPH